MAIPFASNSSLFFSKTLNPNPIRLPHSHSPSSISFSPLFNPRTLKSPSFRLQSTLSGQDSSSDEDPAASDKTSGSLTDEWGEKSEPEPVVLASDPPKDEDEWGGGVEEEYVTAGNGSAVQAKVEEAVVPVEDYKLQDLKRCLVDSVYGTGLGIRTSSEVRAEVTELVNQLEAVNPTKAPVEASGLLDGNWILLYTASSELLPLLAVGTTPLLKVEKICQSIDTTSRTIVNTATYSSPFATFSFSASADFEVRSPSRIQVTFKEGTFPPPEIKSSIDLPANFDLFGQNINLIPVQQSLNPLQEAVASISRVISGQPPLKLPIPGERSKSWLLTTYLDQDLRISRGDGGLFVLAKEGSSLLNQ